MKDARLHDLRHSHTAAAEEEFEGVVVDAHAYPVPDEARGHRPRREGCGDLSHGPGPLLPDLRRGGARPEPTIADALLDRIVHNAYRIDLKGESQRKRNKLPPLDGGDKGAPA